MLELPSVVNFINININNSFFPNFLLPNKRKLLHSTEKLPITFMYKKATCKFLVTYYTVFFWSYKKHHSITSFLNELSKMTKHHDANKLH